MSDSDPSHASDRQLLLERLLADYLHSVERGQPLDRQSLIAAHPELADDLNSFFRNHDSIDRLAVPLKAAADTPTLLGVSHAIPAQSGLTIRYFGDYELLDEIARGGMGVVFRARQVNLNRVVALKMILAGQLAHDSDVKRFYAEAESAASLDHPGIVPIFEIGQHDSQHYFSMAFVEGESLAKKVANGPLPPRDAAQLVRQVSEAVEYAHTKGIIHRDIKPANVLLDGQGQPKVTDFGLAKQTQGDSGLTGTGQILGTPSYMPPEQAAGKLEQIGPHSDIYSLGALLYCLVTGRPPFQAASPTDTLLQVLNQDPVAPRQLNPQVPLDLETIALKCLEKEPARRYASATDVAQELGRFLRGEPILARPVGWIEREWRWCKRNPLVAGLIAAIYLVLLVGMAVAWQLERISNSNAKVAQQNAHEAGAQRDRADEMSQTALHEKELAEQQRQLAVQQAQLARDHAQSAEQARDQMQQARQTAEDQRQAADRARGEAEAALYFNRISLAQQYWIADNLSGSRRILDDCPLDRRGWEWRYLDRLHHTELVNVPGNGQFTSSLKFSADGKRMAAFAQSGDAGVRVWDMTTNKPLSEMTLTRSQRPFTCGDLSADGKTVVLGDRSGAISFWDADSGQLQREFTKLPRSVGSLSLSPDGKWLAAARADGRNGERLLPLTEPPRNEDLVVWDVASGEEVFHPQGHGFVALFSPDGSRLLSFKMNTSLRLHPAAPENFLALFDTANWKEIPTKEPGTIRSFTFSNDGKRLAIGGVDRPRDAQFIRVLESATGSEVSALTPSRAVGDIALNPDGTILAACGPFGTTTIETWTLKQPRPLGMLRGHLQPLNAVIFSPDGRLASCSWDNTIKLWNATAGQQVSRQAGPVVLADPVALSTDGELLAYGQRNTVNILTGPVKTVTLFDAKTGSVRRTLPGHDRGTNCLAFSGDGARLVSGGRKGDIKVWDINMGKPLSTIRAADGEIVALALSPEGRLAASAHEPPDFTRARHTGQFQNLPRAQVAIKVWDANTGKERASLRGHPGGVFRLAFSRDGKRLASVGGGGVKIWDVAAGTEISGNHPGVLQSATSSLLQFSPAGNLLVTSAFKSVTLSDVATGQLVATIQGHRSDQIDAAAISPDQLRIATAALDEVKLWELTTGHEILALPLTNAASDVKPRVGALAWTTDGQQLRAALSDGAILTWDGQSRPERKENASGGP
jgi:WD40 repeat protein